MNVTSKVHRTLFGLFVFFMLLPMLWLSLTHQRAPWTPRLFTFLLDTSDLSPHGFETLQVFFLQARSSPEAAWSTLQESDYFFMNKGLGHRTRFSRYAEIYFTADNPIVKLAGDDLSWWMWRRYKELHLGAEGMWAFRILRANYRVGVRPGQTQWTDPPLDSFKPEELSVVYERDFRVHT